MTDSFNMNTVAGLIGQAPDQGVALMAPGLQPMTYGQLKAQIRKTAALLNAQGIGRNDRVATLLPNSSTMAAVFVAVSSCCTIAPLNPAYRAEEIEFYLSDLGAKAIILDSNAPAFARDVAARLNVRIVTVTESAGHQAGSFELAFDAASAPDMRSSAGLALADDIALILHTSGTTSRPKIVPLTHSNVTASARNVRDALQLTADDCGLHVMPLFHIHGLIAGLSAPLSAGGKVFCTRGFNALKFFAWMEEASPTWYSAVPTMHQTILARAAQNTETIKNHPLRLIRSSSSSMPPQVIAAVEQTFKAPLIEAYGMTEAAHQMASNPLPPRPRKPGTVGLAAGPRVAIMDMQGNLLPAGMEGEIVVAGSNITAGYENNPKANAEAFTQEWFRTGDVGQLDADGYLSITGRLKEIINRGGEKISPREIDELLMDHPGVQQVVTFALPHDKLGEEVAAAVVLKDGYTVAEQELREFAAQRVASFKVLRKILFISEIPKGPTGKLQRIGLAQKLGLVKKE